MNPNDFNEEDEIAKIYAEIDMAKERHEKLVQSANMFYRDFENVSISDSINRIKSLIMKDELTVETVDSLLKNMIKVFEKTEEYEKCSVILKIKKGL